MHSQVAPVFMYVFAHRGKASLGAAWMGVPHGENIFFDFGVPLLPKFSPYYSVTSGENFGGRPGLALFFSPAPLPNFPRSRPQVS